MSLCSACRSISVPTITRELPLDNLPPWLWELRERPNKPRGMVHLDDARQLIASASAGCSCCDLIAYAVLQDINATVRAGSTAAGQSLSGQGECDVQQLQLRLAHQPIYLQTNYDPVKPSFPEDDQPGSWHIRGLKAFVPVDQGAVVGRIRLYASSESQAGSSCNIIGRPPLSSSDAPEAFCLIQRWMSACLAKHQLCRESLCGAVIDQSKPPILPSRVIYVGKVGDTPAVRLLETHGERGRYVALSHCWGSPDHRTLMTTQSSLADYLVSIAWDALPTTYQHAITATQRLGFEYIWIDSLCIIQDSHADWLSESHRMGDIYQHSDLTIAASHAADCSQPCFFSRPAPARTVELPDAYSHDQTKESIYASVLASDYVAISPESGPLASRAWATQEWLLSRRMIFYTEGSLVWSCKTISQRETGASFHSTARNPRWKNLVEKYSARQLTKQTDRLIALEGVRREMAKKRNDDTYCFGLWKNSMPDQLLWFCLQPGERHKCELDLPSWTWASTVHGVRFLNLKGAKNTCPSFRFDEDVKTLTIKSVVKRLPKLTRRTHLEGPWISTLFVDVSHSIVSDDLQFSIEAEAGRHIGWCLFDEVDTHDSNVFGIQLMRNVERLQGSDGKRTRLYTESMLLVRRDNDSEGDNVYKRVGVGSICTTEPWFKDCVLQSICIQ
ncbi:heterokaryon incompatibility protein-domain-containing protein [Phaeosphaeria sp. MPI-PUGE-AT-0046c]|nr:heterokaryon incompatibility protein-domain-containing protein [Phaeosphaeria sp. MPI-PUGE-AT-0046c]